MLERDEKGHLNPVEEISVKDEEIAHLTHCISNAENVILSQREEIELLRSALCQIELCANNSMSSRGECGAIAWKALRGIP